MFKLVIEQDAVQDIKQLVAKGGHDKVCALRIVAILQDIKASQHLLQDLTTDRFATDDYDVGKYLAFWDDGIDLWKIKIYDFNTLNDKWWTLPYRVLYAYDMSSLTFRVLGIVHRNFNYDPNHELTQRILRAYNNLGLQKHRIFGAPAAGRNKPH
jgi:hypothetical protein